MATRWNPVMAASCFLCAMLAIGPAHGGEMDGACGILFEQAHTITFKVEQINREGENIVFFGSGPGVVLTGSILQDGTAIPYRLRLEISTEEMGEMADLHLIKVGDLATLEVVLRSAERYTNSIILTGKLAGAGRLVALSPETVAELVPESAHDFETESESATPSSEAQGTLLDAAEGISESEPDPPAVATKAQSPTPPKDTPRVQPAPLAPFLRNWERGVIDGIKSGDSMPVPPLVEGRMFRCKLQRPERFGEHTTIRALHFTSVTLSERDALTESERAQLELVRRNLKQRLFEAERNVRDRDMPSHQQLIEDLRGEGRQIVGLATRRIEDAAHKVVLKNSEELRFRRGQQSKPCVIKIDVVGVEYQGPLPLLVFEATLME